MTRYFKMKVRRGERIRCDKCRYIIVGRDKEPHVFVYLREAIREDDAIDQLRCERCYDEEKKLGL